MCTVQSCVWKKNVHYKYLYGTVYSVITVQIHSTLQTCVQYNGIQYKPMYNTNIHTIHICI